MKLYLDSSALVKLVQREAESEELRRHLRRHREAVRATSALSHVEVIRAVLPGGPVAIAHARRQLGRVHHVALGPEVLERAATLGAGTVLRTLDAIHLAAAQTIGADLAAVITYDRRMADAADAMGLPVEAPA